MAEPTPLNIIRAMSKAQWRGQSFPPYDMAGFSGGHGQAPRRTPYRDVGSHDNTGRTAIPMRFRMYFLNSLRPKMYPELFETWLNIFILDGTVGPLVHPVLGDRDARPLEWEVEAVAERTSGLVMNVTFTETLRDPDKDAEIELSIGSVQELAKAADAGMSALSIDYPTGERTTSLMDLIGQIRGLIFSTRLSIEGMINQAMGILDRIIATVESVPQAVNGIALTTAHAAWSLLYSLKSLRNSVKDLGKTVGIKSNRRVTSRKVAHSTTLDRVASDTGNDLSDMIALNPNLLGTPSVSKGSTVRYYAE